MFVKRNLVTIILILIGTFSFITFFGSMNFEIQGFRFKIYLQIFDKGFSEINIPPIGKISAKTHKTPIKIGITLLSIDMDFLRQVFEKPIEKKEILDHAIMRLNNVLKLFVFKLLVLAFFGGSFSMVFLHYKKPIHYIRAGIAGLVIMSLLLLGTYYTYDINKFSNPQFKGILKAAPWMIGLAEQALVKVDVLGDKLQLTATNLYHLFERVDYLEPLGREGSIKILHVSDIHNNPAAYDFIRQVADNFNVDVIIDSGDISDFGTPLEANLIKKLLNVSIPYFFVAGNHDSPEIIKVMEDIPAIKVLNEDVINYKGITIAGVSDPAAATLDVVLNNEESILRSQNKIISIINNNKPDLVVVHRPSIAYRLAGKVPIILCGHNHQLSVIEKNNSIIVNAGTTGAAGIRGFQTTDEVPYTLAHIHLNKTNEGWKTIAVDTISISNLYSGFTLKRHVF